MSQEQLVIEQLEIKNAQLGDQQKRLELTLMKWFATSLLGLCVVLFVVSTALRSSYPWLAYVKAFSEAGMVGALADWFAVVALFRRPLGLPIPHTALIPANKHRIADNLGDFIKSNFLSPRRITAQIQALNVAGRIAGFLSSKEGSAAVAGHVTHLVGKVLDAMNHERVAAFIHQGLITQLQKIDLSQSAAGVLDILRREEAHMQLLDLGIEEIHTLLQSEDTREVLIEKITASINEYSTMLPADWLAPKVARKFIDGAASFVKEVQGDKQHRFRKGFDAKLNTWIEMLRRDPMLKYRANQLRDHLLQSAEVTSYVNRLWADLSAWILSDIHSRHSVIENHLVDVLTDLGTRLDQDESLKQLINQKIEEFIPDLLLRYRDAIGSFIADQIKEWDDVFLVEKLELNVGKDLQFIRINGTLVGGCVGLLIYAVSLLIG